MNRTRATLALVAALALAGCPNHPSIVGCTDSTVCTLAAGGQCLPAPVGFDVCAYPDTTCPSGLSWSPQAGDLAGECLDSDEDAGIDASGPDAAPACGNAPSCASLIDLEGLGLEGFTRLGTITGDAHTTPGPFPVTTSYESPNGDPAWYRVRVADTSAPGSVNASVRLETTGTAYTMRVYCSSCGGRLAMAGSPNGTGETAGAKREDTDGDDSLDLLIEVVRAPGVATCGTYRLFVVGNDFTNGPVTCN